MSKLSTRADPARTIRRIELWGRAKDLGRRVELLVRMSPNTEAYRLEHEAVRRELDELEAQLIPLEA